MKTRRSALALLCLLGCVLAWLPTSSAHADTRLPVRIDITTVSLDGFDLAHPTEITITGTATNESPNRMNWLAAEVWRSAAPLTTPEQVGTVAAADPFTPSGTRLSSVEKGNRQQLTSEDWFNPGQTREFTLRATLPDLGFTQPGAYPIGVHVRALDHVGDVRTVGIARWLVPVFEEPPGRVSIVQLTSAPSLASPGVFASDALVRDLPRLTALATRAERPGTTFVVDPALVDELAALAQPHSIDGTDLPASQDAAALLTRINRLATRGGGYRLPYGNPDLRRAQATGDLDLVTSMLPKVTTADAAVAALPLAILASSGMDPDLFARLATLSPALVLSPDAVATTRNVVSLSTKPAVGLQPDPTSAVAVEGQAAAEELVAALSGQPLVRMLTSADGAADTARERPLVVSSSAPIAWREPRSLPPDPALTRALSALDTDVSMVTQLTSDVPITTEAARRTLTSRSLDLSPAAAIALMSARDPLIPTPPVSLKVQRSFVMAGKQNTFPVSVANHTSVPVAVNLVLRSTNPQRLATPDKQPIVLRPGETSSINVELVSAGAGVVAVIAQLQTNGGVAVTPEQAIEITSSNAGILGWIIIAVSGLVVIGSTVWRIRSVQKAKARSAG